MIKRRLISHVVSPRRRPAGDAGFRVRRRVRVRSSPCIRMLTCARARMGRAIFDTSPAVALSFIEGFERAGDVALGVGVRAGYRRCASVMIKRRLISDVVPPHRPPGAAGCRAASR
jgi:hypothetical protein